VANRLRGEFMKGRSFVSGAVVAVGVGSLVFASMAFAQSSSVQGYGGEAGGVSAGVAGGGGNVAGTLPFTGLDLMFLALAGAVVLLLGFALRRFGRAQA
jgi:hypothetical protein